MPALPLPGPARPGPAHMPTRAHMLTRVGGVLPDGEKKSRHLFTFVLNFMLEEHPLLKSLTNQVCDHQTGLIAQHRKVAHLNDILL